MFRGKPLFSHRVPRSGLQYAPELDWILTAQWANETWASFNALDGDEQSMLVAAYRTSMQMQAVIAKAQSDDMKRRTRK